METLIIFLIFIVFSVIRSMGRQGQQQSAPRMPVPPGLPRQPQMPPQPHRPQRRVPTPQAEPAFNQEYDKPVVRLRPPERPPLPKPESKERAWESPIADLHYAQHKVEDREFDLRLDSDSVLLGVVFSEVLGQPRARRKNIFPVRPVR